MNTHLLTASDLRAAGRELPVPFAVQLGDGRTLTLHTPLRVLPGKRIAGIGELGGRMVFAKLFIAATGAERHWQRESHGKSVMVTRQVTTPAVLGEGALAQGGHYLLTEYLADARTLGSDATPDHLAKAFAAFGRLHAAGLVHEDAHLDNLLLDGNAIHIIDGDAVRETSSPRELHDNLALFLAQLPPAIGERLGDTLLSAYRSSNPSLAIDPIRLIEEAAAARQRRLADYLKKCVRDCSLFQVLRQGGRFVAMVRDEAGLLAPIVADPDRWLDEGRALKRGNTATLAAIEHAGRRLVIKRYNIKGAAHALSRFWRPSRAWHSWVAANRLVALGIRTPRPLAMIEQRFGPLRGRAWLIVEHCPGSSFAEQPPADEEIAAVGQLFGQLASARISHGDLKASNLLRQEGGIGLIDLDAMRQHRTDTAWRRAWRRDRARFLRNWPDYRELNRRLDAVLPPA